MTLEQTMRAVLDNGGLFPNQVDAVISAYKADEISSPLVDRWNDNVEGYETNLLVAIRAGIFAQAVIWIDNNTPRHFARPYFALEV